MATKATLKEREQIARKKGHDVPEGVHPVFGGRDGGEFLYYIDGETGRPFRPFSKRVKSGSPAQHKAMTYKQVMKEINQYFDESDTDNPMGPELRLAVVKAIEKYPDLHGAEVGIAIEDDGTLYGKNWTPVGFKIRGAKIMATGPNLSSLKPPSKATGRSRQPKPLSQESLNRGRR